MAWYSTKRATTVVSEGKGHACIYHQTKVVVWDDEKITLNSGGHMTATTKKRMNEVSEEYRLGYRVFQKAGEWFICRRWATSCATT